MLNEQALLLVWSISAICAMTLAMGRERNPLLWLAITLPLGPTAPALLLALPPLPDRTSPLEREAMELCDACHEPVRRDRDACRYCGA